MSSDLSQISDTLWNTADRLRANSGVPPSEYARPVLGLLFLRHADERFAEVEKKLSPRAGSPVRPGPDAYKAEGAIYLPPEARFAHLMQLPEGENLGKALTKAMRDIEDANNELADVLPKTYQQIPEGLPPAYDQGVFDEKVERTYQWVFEKYPGERADPAPSA